MDEVGLADIARHVRGCHLTVETSVQSALDDEGLADVARHVIGRREEGGERREERGEHSEERGMMRGERGERRGVPCDSRDEGSKCVA